MNINTNNKKYAIAVIFNDAYVPGAFVFFKTFLKYNPWYNGDIVCFYDNKYCCISDENKNNFQKIFPNLYFKYVDYHIYDKFVEHFYEKMTFKRFIVSAYTLEAFALKYDRNGNEYDKVVFLDIDQIIEGDLSLLFLHDKDIVAAPGDNFLINDINEDALFYRDVKNINISGGLFSISKKYLGENIRNEIIKFGETFEFDKPEYGKCNGNGFEMHVLDIWFRDKDLWITSSIYAYPSIIFYYNYSDKIFRTIAYKLFENSRIFYKMYRFAFENGILHIWHRALKQRQRRFLTCGNWRIQRIGICGKILLTNGWMRWRHMKTCRCAAACAWHATTLRT